LLIEPLFQLSFSLDSSNEHEVRKQVKRKYFFILLIQTVFKKGFLKEKLTDIFYMHINE